MLKLFGPLLDDIAGAPLDLAPRRYGLVTACDGGLLEVSGLSAPVGDRPPLSGPFGLLVHDRLLRHGWP